MIDNRQQDNMLFGGVVVGIIIVFLVLLVSACGPEPGDDSQSPAITINNYQVTDSGSIDDADSEVEDNSTTETSTNTETIYDDDNSAGGNIAVERQQVSRCGCGIDGRLPCYVPFKQKQVLIPVPPNEDEQRILPIGGGFYVIGGN